MCAKSLSHVQLFVTLWTIAHGIFQAGILEWVAMSSSRDLPDPGNELTSPVCTTLASEFFTTEPVL